MCVCRNATLALFLMQCFFVTLIKGHGRLIDPPSRSTMWRYGFLNNRNYDDNGVNCGGFGTQWGSKANGKCGVCGDSYFQKQPRDNERGGRYGKAGLTQQYSTGDVITTKVEVTANHKGYFVFALCPLNDNMPRATDECFDQRPLKLVDSPGYKWTLKHSIKRQTYSIRLKLPDNFECNHCVFRWKWRAGNNWGMENGIGGVGRGKQEHFYGCSDISIKNRGRIKNKVISTVSKTNNKNTKITKTRLPKTQTTVTVKHIKDLETTNTKQKSKHVTLSTKRGDENLSQRVISTTNSNLFVSKDNIHSNHTTTESGSVTHSRCGACDNSYFQKQQRNAEKGGRYGQAEVTFQFSTGGVITTRVELTANQKGYLVFALCILTENMPRATDGCFDQRPLKLLDSPGYKLPVMPSKIRQIFSIRLKLPEHIECDHCVFRWKWTAGISRGMENIFGRIERGKPERFFGCSDISIKNFGHNQNKSISTLSKGKLIKNKITKTQLSNTQKYVTIKDVTDFEASNADQNSKYVTLSTKRNDDNLKQRVISTTSTNSFVSKSDIHWKHIIVNFDPRQEDVKDPQTKVFTSKTPRAICRPTGVYVKVPGMKSWCQTSCIDAICSNAPRHCCCGIFCY